MTIDENSLLDPFSSTVSQESIAGMSIDPDHIEHPLETPGTLTDQVVLGEGENVEAWLHQAMDGHIEYSNESLDPVIQPEEHHAVIEGIVTDDVNAIAELNNIADEIRNLGGVNKALVLEAEAIEPTAITRRIPLNAFSNFTTTGETEVSLESLGSAIKDILVRLIRNVADVFRKRIDWITSLFDDDKKDISPKILTDRRKALLDEATRLDSVYGSQALLKTLGRDDPLAIRSASGRDYTIRLIDKTFLTTMDGKFTTGFKAISYDSTYGNHVKSIRDVINGELSKLRADIGTLKGSDPSNWKTNDNENAIKDSLGTFFRFAGVSPDWNKVGESFSRYSEVISGKYNVRTTTGNLKEFTVAANYSNPFGTPTEGAALIKNIERDLKESERLIRDLEKVVSKLDDKGSYNIPTSVITSLQKRLSIITSLIQVYRDHHRRYVHYFNSLDHVLSIIARKLKAVGTTQRLTQAAT